MNISDVSVVTNQPLTFLKSSKEESFKAVNLLLHDFCSDACYIRALQGGSEWTQCVYRGPKALGFPAGVNTAKQTHTQYP